MREQIKKYLFEYIKEKDGEIDDEEINNLIQDKFPEGTWNSDLLNWYRYHITSNRGRFYNDFSSQTRQNVLDDFTPRRKGGRKNSRDYRDKRNNVLKNDKVEDKKLFDFEFDKDLAAEANNMSQNYEIIYCLEKTIRRAVSNQLSEIYGEDWWKKCASYSIKEKVEKNKEFEKNTGHTLISSNEIDYTTFGILRVLVEENWKDLSSVFKNKHAFNRIMRTLNQLRGPIAHNNYLTEDEETRLVLTVKDWFRLVKE